MHSRIEYRIVVSVCYVYVPYKRMNACLFVGEKGKQGS